MVGHDHEGIEHDLLTQRLGLAPLVLYDTAEAVQAHLTIDDVAKQGLTLMRADVTKNPPACA